MRTFGFPMARGAGGARGPQISPGTFEARSGPYNPLLPDFGRPELPTVILWSPGLSSPDVELWCYRAGPAPVPPLPLADALFGRVDGAAVDMGWVDEIPAGNAFQAPPGASPDSQTTADALKAYAADRLDYTYATGVPANEWMVQVARPYPAVTPGTPFKVLGDQVFSVAQIDRISGPVPVAWVWVTDGGRREIWLLYRPGELGGFAFPGSTPAGESDVYTSTSLRFNPVVGAPGAAGWDVVLNYEQAITNFKATALTTPMCPAINEYDLEVHDFRIEDYP